MKTNVKKGFTLIELLIVIAIIGILAAALLPNILGAPMAARDTARKVAVNDVVTAIESYKAASNALPRSVAGGECLVDASGAGKLLAPMLKDNFQTMLTNKKLDQAIWTSCTANGIYYFQAAAGVGSRYYVCVGLETTVAPAVGVNGGYTLASDPSATAPGAGSSKIYCVYN